MLLSRNPLRILGVLLILSMGAISIRPSLGQVGRLKIGPQGPRSEAQSDPFQIGPIPGLTLGWHAAPEKALVPLGSRIEMRLLVPNWTEIVWTGADEIRRDRLGSTSECHLTRLGKHEVRVKAMSRDGQQLIRRCTFEVKDFSPNDVRLQIVKVFVDPEEIDEESTNEETVERWLDPEPIAELFERGPGDYVTALRKQVRVRAQVDPPQLASLVEWRVDGSPKSLGIKSSHRFLETGSYRISVGPLDVERQIQIQTFGVDIESDPTGFPEEQPITFHARTIPPGYEPFVTWRSATKYGQARPATGTGPVFTVVFQNTFGPSGESWVGVGGGDQRLGNDQVNSCSVSISGPRCVSRGFTVPFVAQGTPFGGTYTWSITQGGMATIVGSSRLSSVMVQGNAISTAVDDVVLKVDYAVSGFRCSATIGITVIDPLLSFKSSGSADQDNDKRAGPAVGLPTLGPVSPGNPAGCMGFFKNMEVKAEILSCPQNLSCDFDFKRRVRGRVGTLRNGMFVPDLLDCPGGPCDDDPDDTDEDLILDPSPKCTVFSVDAPGWEITPVQPGAPASCRQADSGIVLINCAEFRERLNVDGHQGTNDLFWFASTRIRCDGTNYVLDDPDGDIGNGVGRGMIPPGCDTNLQFLDPPSEPFRVDRVIEDLGSESIVRRLQSQNRILLGHRQGTLFPEDIERLVAELTWIALHRNDAHGMWSSPMLALRLLGVLGVDAVAGIDVVLDRILDPFSRPITRAYQSSVTVAGEALARMGSIAVAPILERAAWVSDEAWDMLERSLQLMRDQGFVRSAIDERLARELDDHARQRLEKYRSERSR